MAMRRSRLSTYTKSEIDQKLQKTLEAAQNRFEAELERMKIDEKEFKKDLLDWLTDTRFVTNGDCHGENRALRRIYKKYL